MTPRRLALLSPFAVLAALGLAQDSPNPAEGEDKFVSGTRQLTFAGERAGEGYFSADGTQMIFQSEREPGNPFYQIYLLDLETGDTNRVSPGHGKTTCAWIHPSGEKVLFASTQADPDAKSKQQGEIEERQSGRIRKYSWDYDENYDIWETKPDGSDGRKLTDVKGYDAEGSYSPDGEWIAFASNRAAYQRELSDEEKAIFERDKSYFMDLFLMRADGSDVRQLTDVPGYDGGPFFSPDGKSICWRRFSEKGDTAEIMTMVLESGVEKQLTHLGAMSWAPYFHPSGEYLIFTTNKHGFGNFELYLVDAAGEKEPVRVTRTDGFDGLPTFTPDGDTLSWTTNRTPGKKSQIFLAKWDHAGASHAIRLAPQRGKTPAVETTADINAKDLRAHLEYLASESLQGRLTGTEGERLATQYVADHFERIGLQPGGDDGTYFENFEFTAGIDLGDGNTLSSDSLDPLRLDEDWRPLSFTQTGEIDASGVVFAGYGLEVPGENGKELYSSYFHLDVKDKWVLLLRYMPEEIDEEKRSQLARYSNLRYKALIARQKGARGIVVVSGPNSKVKNQLVPLGTDAAGAGSGIAAVSISDEVAIQLLEAGKSEKTLAELQTALDTGEMVQGFELEGVALAADLSIKQEKRTGRNVVGYLPAKDPHMPSVLIGAHVDHLGPDIGPGSRATGEEEDKIHYGADDNASGTAGLMEIAEYLCDQKDRGKLKLERGAVFVAWSGEEIGLLGSSHHARATAKMFFGDEDAKLDKLYAAALNMDMIGRFEEKLVLQGVGSSGDWPAIIEQRNAPLGLPIVTQSDSYLATDATSFYLRGVPILNAFTGAHDDYHTPRDTVDKIDFEGAADVSKFMALVMRGMLQSADAPAYVAMKKPENKNTRGGLRAYLGTIPDYSQGDIVGVKLSGVTKGAPAAEAGVLGGDIVVGLGGKEILNIYDYTHILGSLKVGAETDITVNRKGETQSFKITPSSRD